ncbi:hypothetical protein LIT25_06460 [Bacillus sp. F19]|nr:hypothetical protein LIT25_06460 [Bacillus sp. F19]
MKTLKVHKIRNSLMQLKPFWHNIEQLQNKGGDILSSNIENGGKDSNSVDILQLFGQWLTTTEDAISIIGQAIALENDKLQQIQDQKEKEPLELQLQQTLQQMTQTQEKIRLLQKQKKIELYNRIND